MFRKLSRAEKTSKWGGCRQGARRTRRMLIERLEQRYVLDAGLADLSDDLFDVHQNGLAEPLDVLANDRFGSDYAGPRQVTSVSYGSEGGSVAIAADRQSILYAPPADFAGIETFLYVVDNLYTAEVQVSIAAPLGSDQFEIPPDGVARRLDVMENDPFWPDYDRERLITSVSVGSAGGTVEIAPDRRAVQYTPPEGAFGKDQFVYIVDGIYPARVTVSIPKTLKEDRFAVVQSTQQETLRVLANDPFWPGYAGERRITHVTDTQLEGTVEIASDGRSVIYSPPEGRSGWDSFRYVVDATYEAQVRVAIHRPVRDDWFEIDQNSTDQLLVLTANDSYRDLGDIERYIVVRVTDVSDPESGAAVTISADGQGVIYTPPEGFSGLDTFTYIADGLYEAQVRVQVTRPVRDDSIYQGVYQDTPAATLDVLANDFLGNGYSGPKQITAVGPTEREGEVVIGLGGRSLSYTPPPGFVGPDQFVYTVDGQLDAQVTVGVRALAQGDYFRFCADPTHGPYVLDVLENDHFRQGYPGPGVITAVSATDNGGDVTVADGRQLLFVPGSSGRDSFRYTVDDRYEAAVTVSITGHLRNDSFVIDQNSPASDLDVLANDFANNHRRECASSDYRGSRRITGVSDSEQGGIVTIAEDGSRVRYQPPNDFQGDDRFTYTVDGLMQTTISIHVIRRVRDDQFRVDAEGGIEPLAVLVNDLFGADYSGAGQITAVSAPSAGGSAVVADDLRSIDYAPPAGFVGTDTFVYTVDGALKAEVRVVVGTSRDEQFPTFGSLEEYQQFLIDDALVRYEHLFGQPAWQGYWMSEDGFPGQPRVFTNSSGDRSHSETNVQVEGVDEADIIEFDSDFVYMLTDEELVIVDAWPAEEMSVASRVAIEGTPIAEFLQGDRLTVISGMGGGFFPREPLVEDVIWPPWPPIPPVPLSTIVTVLDVTDRTAPAVVQTTTMEGSYIDSRAVDQFVYLLLRNHAVAPPPEVIAQDDGETTPEDGSPSPFDGDLIFLRPPVGGGVYETREEYVERITANSGELIDGALPNYTAYGPDGQVVRTGLLTDSEAIHQPLVPGASNLISVVSFQVTGDEPGLASTSSVYGTGGTTIYASLENFYVFDRDWSSEDGSITRIMKFDWDVATGGVQFASTTTVPGSILNQFSADENGPYLRIATTISNSASGNWSGRSENALFVLRDDQGVFEVVGSLQNLALDETIRSVRYLGDRAFVTTFRNVDPLFGLDLSDPQKPRSLGHLTLPGFSSYMQLIDATHLLTVGQNTPNGFRGPTQVALFDVSDLAQPLRIDEFTFPRFSISEAELDHHAFGYYAEHGLLAIPTSRRYVERVDEDGDGYREARQWVDEYQLAILGIDTAANLPSERGVQLLGEIEHDRPVRRSGFIDRMLYSIANDSVQVVDVADPATVIGALIVEEDRGTDPTGTGNGGDIVVNFPPSVSDGPLAAAVAAARGHLAGRLQTAAGAPIAVSAESSGSEAGGSFRIVLRVADDQYLYRADGEGAVQLAYDDYVFPGESETPGVWHAIRAPLVATPGDMDIDGDVDIDDIGPFVLALSKPAAYESVFGGPSSANGDLDGDGDLDFDDIDDMVALLHPASVQKASRSVVDPRWQQPASAGSPTTVQPRQIAEPHADRAAMTLAPRAADTVFAAVGRVRRDVSVRGAHGNAIAEHRRVSIDQLNDAWAETLDRVLETEIA